MEGPMGADSSFEQNECYNCFVQGGVCHPGMCSAASPPSKRAPAKQRRVLASRIRATHSAVSVPRFYGHCPWPRQRTLWMAFDTAESVSTLGPFRGHSWPTGYRAALGAPPSGRAGALRSPLIKGRGTVEAVVRSRPASTGNNMRSVGRGARFNKAQ